MCDLKTVLISAKQPDSYELLKPFWEESLKYLTDQPLFFLEEKAIKENRALCGLPEELDISLLKTAARVRADAHLRVLIWHLYCLVFRHQEYTAESIRKWPDFSGIFGSDNWHFYQLINLASVPEIRRIHQLYNIPEAVTAETLSDTLVKARFNREICGVAGSNPRNLSWRRNFIISPPLCQVGRFQYILKNFPDKIRVFKNKTTQAVIAFAEHGIQYTEEGYIFPEGLSRQENSWQSELVINDKITGHPISPYGRAMKKKIRLESAEWECVLNSSSPVLDIHIPVGGGMTMESVHRSMSDALIFFDRYFPGRKVRGFRLVTWFLNTLLEQYYRPDSNLVMFQKQVYLFPVPTGYNSGLYFIFGSENIDLKTAPRDTSIRRAMLKILEDGRPLRSEGMFFLREHIEHFGAAYYREQWEQKVKMLI
ncbi:MAG: hypothetical protein A2096_06275 [Spirochaetes bacterium GWF1_41_5]|nr:MAG: hypothetical protein A2096_06275 [Spirochaetes bacterium GWF1_41_5]HBE04508.1 hypothetical protein [Spirochaetia bacterium]